MKINESELRENMAKTYYLVYSEHTDYHYHRKFKKQKNENSDQGNLMF
jgi:hypothetical protein